MNIIHLRASNFYGGPERQLHVHAVRSLGSPYGVTVCSFVEHGLTPRFLKVIASDNVPTHAFDVRNPYDPAAVSALRRYMTQEQTDILCTHDYRSHLIGWLATRGSSTRWLAFSRGWTAENVKVRIYHTIEKMIIRFADHVVAVSDAQRRRLTRRLVPGRKMSVVHNAIDVSSLDNLQAVDLRSHYRFPSEAVICITAGRFSREKGQAFLVRAAAQALDPRPDLRFVLYGDGPDLASVRNLICRLGLQDRVLCPGFETDMMAHVKGADILINPSLSEGLPNVVLEAMALKIPVVATAVGGVPEIIDDGDTGYLVPARDVSAMAAAVVRAASEPKAAAQIAERGRRRVLDRFSFDLQYERLTEIYRKLVP
ncbi:MAG TPA: glycosyltransferase [Acidobacteriota bacterium]|nr:glycosyltransferase [Acidobacteriota bacterium]